MDWKTTLTTFGMIFLAEMGDKTQLATITFTAKSRSPWAVFLGSATALCLASLLGVLFGGVLTRYIPPEALHRAAAIGFIAIGALMLAGKL